MAQADSRGKDGRWSLEGTTALVTGGTKGIGFVSLCMLSFPTFYFQLHKKNFAVFMASASRVLRQTEGCLCVYIHTIFKEFLDQSLIHMYIGMLLWRNWQGLGR